MACLTEAKRGDKRENTAFTKEPATVAGSFASAVYSVQSVNLIFSQFSIVNAFPS